MSGRLREVETDLTGTKERCEQQAHDLLRKSSKYGQWCAKFYWFSGNKNKIVKMLISGTFLCKITSIYYA